MHKIIKLSPGHEIEYEHIKYDQASSTIVLVNGSIFNFYQWDLLLKSGFRSAAPRQFNLLRYNYGKIGNSKSPSSNWDLRALARELYSLMEALSIDKAHLYGLSKGTCVIQALAAEFPGCASSLGGYGWYNPCYSDLEQMNRILQKRLENFSRLSAISEDQLTCKTFNHLWDKVYREIIFQKSYADLTLKEKLASVLLRHKLRPLMIPTSTKVMYDWFKYAIDEIPAFGKSFHEKQSRLRHIPCLIQHAANDLVLPVEMAHELHHTLPQSKLIEYHEPFTHVSIGFKQKQARTVIKDYIGFLRTL
jgi:pimeloyl-ACP methyl ester carboxylesterase